MMRWFVGMIALLLLVPFGFAASWQSVVQVSCENEMCIEGSPINYTVTIANTGDNDFTIREIEIRDSEGINLALIPNLNVTIQSGQYRIFRMASVTPPAVRGSTVIYDVCYVIEEYGRSSQACDMNKRFLTIVPTSEVECKSDDDCGRGYECRNFKCFERPKTQAEIIGSYLGYFTLILILSLGAYFVWWLKKH